MCVRPIRCFRLPSAAEELPGANVKRVFSHFQTQHKYSGVSKKELELWKLLLC